MVGSFPVGGLSREEAEKTIKSQIDYLNKNGISFFFKDRSVTIPVATVATDDPDLSYEIIKYDIPKTLSAAFDYGRTGLGLEQWVERLSGIFKRKRIDPYFEWDKDVAYDILRQNLSSFEHPGKNAQLVIENFEPKITKEQSGIIFDYEKSLDEADRQLLDLVFYPIEFKLKPDEPTVFYDDAIFLLEDAKNLIYKKGVSLTYENLSWYWSYDTVNKLFEIRVGEEGDLEIGLSEAGLRKLLAPIAVAVNIEPQEPRFALENEKVKEFKAGVDGKKLNFEKNIIYIEEALLKTEERPEKIQIIIEEAKAGKNLSDINEYGISDLLGIGMTNFAGSPKNRRHNISNGANTLTGMIIDPGEEFSLVSSLGNIDKESGYLPELVIKGNKTVPEYGGGLCQIGTTLFRAALNSSLPITERRPHSYMVSYYFDENGKPGKDATIYIPHPDFRFLNDTGSHILMISRIEGDNLYFEFWGKKDGRSSVQSDVSVWDRVPAPETKYVETLSLKPGERKCTEHPHAGMKASFDYSITYASGEQKEQTFFSHYQPWQEVCLVGVEKLTEKVDDETLKQDSSNTEVAPSFEIQSQVLE